MLALIRRIGTEFGVNIVVSSHHLEEVERICDAVVIVEGGEVVRAGTLEDLGAARVGSSSRWTSGRTSWPRSWRRSGLEVSVDGDVLLLGASDEA